MRRLFHICLTSHSEVLFRNEEDYLWGINCLALTCLDTGSRIGTFSFQSDHIHFDMFTEIPWRDIARFKNSYTRHFNHKYSRTGPLLNAGYFCLELVGARHIEAAESYILRNSVHHAITSTPFGYPYNSSSCYYSSDFSRYYLDNIDFAKYKIGNFLPANGRPDKKYLLNNRGMISADYFMEISMVEKFFGSARGYNYCMTRLSGEEWERYQQKDENGLPSVTLATIETPYTSTIEKLLENEKGKYAGSKMTDLQVCDLIDNGLLPRYKVNSYTQLSTKSKLEIYRQLVKRSDVSSRQIQRCLALHDLQ